MESKTCPICKTKFAKLNRKYCSSNCRKLAKKNQMSSWQKKNKQYFQDYYRKNLNSGILKNIDTRVKTRLIKEELKKWNLKEISKLDSLEIYLPLICENLYSKYKKELEKKNFQILNNELTKLT